MKTLPPPVSGTRRAAAVTRCRQKFRRFFPRAFRDPAYLASERGYKHGAHARWVEVLSRVRMQELLRAGRFADIARLAVGIESRTHLLYSFEKMALRDAVRSAPGARAFATGLDAYLHGSGSRGGRFDAWCDVIASLPRLKSRVLTWPVVTVFGFIAQPTKHFFFKPTVTRAAARAYGGELVYESRPSWKTYEGVLELAARMERGLADWAPRDMIDIQSFAWVQGSSEYDE